MHHKTIAELSQELAAKKISSVELTQHFLERIKQFDEKLNALSPSLKNRPYKPRKQLMKYARKAKQVL